MTKLFSKDVESIDRLNLLYDEDIRHYHMIGNLTAAMAKGYVCKACGKGCRCNVANTCDQICSSCLTSSPCVARGVRIPARTATDISGTRRISPTIKGESEIRRPFVSESETVGHAANSSFRATYMNAVSATVTCTPRTERSVTYVICSH